MSSLHKLSVTGPAAVRNVSFSKKKRGPQRKDFGGRYSLPGSYWVFVSAAGLESLSLRPEKVSPKGFLSVVVVYAFLFSIK